MNLVITISRRFGTGASMVSRQLSERLHIPVYGKDDIDRIMQERGFRSEKETIRALAKEPCIILGRCASEFLKDRKNVISIYMSADMEDRIKRVMKLLDLDREGAKKLIEEADENRAAYYYENTGKIWGDMNNYQIILNSPDIGVDNCTGVLMRYFSMKDYI